MLLDRCSTCSRLLVAAAAVAAMVMCWRIDLSFTWHFKKADVHFYTRSPGSPR